MIRYPVNLTREGDSLLVSFPDFPDVHTFGEDEQDALVRARDAVETMINGMMDDREEVPASPRNPRAPFVTLSALSEAKVELYKRMRKAEIGKAELARRLRWHLPQVDRLLDLTHNSRLDQLERAFQALGQELSITLRKAA